MPLFDKATLTDDRVVTAQALPAQFRQHLAGRAPDRFRRRADFHHGLLKGA